MSIDKKKNGRPTKYNAKYIKQVGILCSKGATDVEIADFFNVDLSTINRWKLRYQGFCESINAGKSNYDNNNVVNALLKRAIGYEATETKMEKGPLGTKKTIIKKEIPADPSSIFFWLTNRKKDEWRHKQEFELSGNLDINSIDMTATPEEAARAYAEMMEGK